MTQVEEEESKRDFRMMAETVIRGRLWRVGMILLECCVEQGIWKMFQEISDTRGKWNWSCYQLKFCPHMKTEIARPFKISSP